MLTTNFMDDRLPQRFWDKVAPCPMSGCWLWTAAQNADGYGKFRPPNWPDRNGWRGAHRVAYEALIGPVPDGLDLDHRCRVRSCCNPGHLEPVTVGENIRRGLTGKINNASARKTHCPAGHAYDHTSVAIRRGRVARVCVVCRDARNRARSAC